MNNMSPIAKQRFEDWEKEKLRNPDFLAAARQLEPGYQIARLRIERGLTQEQLAALVGTRQPSIARLENGNSLPSLSFLRRIAAALKATLEVRLIPEEGRKQIREDKSEWLDT
jgi:transcriptional regulator with XRE-family HTH domain